LGVVLVLTAVVLGASAFAYWGLRSDTSSAGADRLSRQLFDCAEQGLAVGKQYFSTSLNTWNAFLNANTVCVAGSNLLAGCQAPLGSGPLPPPASTTAAPPVPQYPNQEPFTHTVNVTLPSGTVLPLQYSFGLYNIVGTKAGETPYTDTDQSVAVYSRCVDMSSGSPGRSRSVTAILTATSTNSNDYLGVDGHGFRNQGNFNN
jgi:hypothetical protein